MRATWRGEAREAGAVLLGLLARGLLLLGTVGAVGLLGWAVGGGGGAWVPARDGLLVLGNLLLLALGLALRSVARALERRLRRDAAPWPGVGVFAAQAPRGGPAPVSGRAEEASEPRR